MLIEILTIKSVIVIMQYNQHPDFLPSLHALYAKNGAYKNAATKVLAVLAKIHYSEIFQENDTLIGIKTTGENRIKHCIKYRLQDHSRLVTIRNNDTCTFLFIGTHEDTENWLNQNRNKTFKTAPLVPTVQSIPLTTTASENDENIQNELAKQLQAITQLRQKLVIDSINFKETIPNTSNPTTKHFNSLKNLFNDKFSQKIQVNLTTITSNLSSSNHIEALKEAEELVYYAEFAHQKAFYIQQVQKYLALVANIKH